MTDSYENIHPLSVRLSAFLRKLREETGLHSASRTAATPQGSLFWNKRERRIPFTNPSGDLFKPQPSLPDTNML